ncbi:MAG: Oligopeptide ABC transporter, periplasmic oligopeptide-binding protein OppA [uncultured Microvirga sp.]|uniref:Oligopeptide ABC transporter, periplasmic oligopeptide-binding protein OppA n=1 Tax=uncultured Microvirga sp. TaxID=412392 RepID=A0A6J4KP96_9HYPH|nr:MAG: Oligopeptide ABC transporter, periplasmic oligopeptide-binding protein OppA [uncultured Microvirga sp.]
MRSRALALALSLSISLTPSALRPQAEPERAVRIVGPWEIGGLDPAQSGYVFSRMQAAETLATVDEAGLVVPHLAERWTASRGGSPCGPTPSSTMARP